MPAPDASVPEQSAGSGGRPRRRIGVLLAVALVVLALDVTTKLVAVAELQGRAPVEVVDGVLTLRLVRNPARRSASRRA